MTTKQEMRKMIRLRKQHHTADESSVVIARLKANPRFLQAHTLLLYSALPDEVQTQALLDELLMAGKTVLLPKVVSSEDMELRRYTGASSLQSGAYGIMEPVGEVFTDYETIDVAVVPGMAFDAKGQRLGRGKGYYDRFLSKLSTLNAKLYKIGLCFSWQIVDEVPSEANDIMMDEVVREG